MLWFVFFNLVCVEVESSMIIFKFGRTHAIIVKKGSRKV